MPSKVFLLRNQIVEVVLSYHNQAFGSWHLKKFTNRLNIVFFLYFF